MPESGPLGSVRGAVSNDRPYRERATVRYQTEFVARIRDLAKDYDDTEIAASLDREGLQSSTAKPFTASMISWIRFKHRIPGPPSPKDALSVAEVGQRYGVSQHVVYYWIETGAIDAKKRKPGTPYAITITDETDRELRKRVANSTRIASSSQTRTVQGAV